MSDSAVPWTVAHQAPLSVGFAKQGYWNGLPFPSPEDQKLTCLHAPSSCLGNSVNRKAWPATVHEVTDSEMTERLTHTHTHTCVHARTHIYTCAQKHPSLWLYGIHSFIYSFSEYLLHPLPSSIHGRYNGVWCLGPLTLVPPFLAWTCPEHLFPILESSIFCSKSSWFPIPFSPYPGGSHTSFCLCLACIWIWWKLHSWGSLLWVDGKATLFTTVISQATHVHGDPGISGIQNLCEEQTFAQ